MKNRFLHNMSKQRLQKQVRRPQSLKQKKLANKYNMMVGDSVRRVIQTATEVIARKRRPRGPQDDESPLMPWAMLDGRVCIYFCDQDMRLSREDGGNSTTVANPFMVCNVERFQSLMQQIHDGIAP